MGLLPAVALATPLGVSSHCPTSLRMSSGVRQSNGDCLLLRASRLDELCEQATRQAQDPALKQRIAERVAELIPLASAVLVPPGEDPENYAILDYSMEETNTFAFNALNRRLKVIGIDLASVAAAA